MSFPNPAAPAAPVAPASQATQAPTVTAAGHEGTTPAAAPVSLTPPPSYGQQGTSVSAADLLPGTPAAAPSPSAPAPAIPSPTAPIAAAPPVVPAQQPPAQQPPAWKTAREFAAANGLPEATSFQNDGELLTGLIQRVQQLGQASQTIQQLQAHVALLTNQAAQVPVAQPVNTPTAAPDPLAAFKAPEFDQSWTQWIERTPNGGYKLVDGAPDPTILPKFVAFQNHQRQMLDQLARDPASVITKILEAKLEERIKPQLEAVVNQQRETAWAETYMRDNADWLYAKGTDGKHAVNPQTGQPQVSAVGRRFYANLAEAGQMGIKDFRHQEQYARVKTQNEILALQAQQRAQPPQQQIPPAAPAQAPILFAPPAVPSPWGPPQQPVQMPMFQQVDQWGRPIAVSPPAQAPASFTPQFNPALRMPQGWGGAQQTFNDPAAPWPTTPTGQMASLNEMMAVAFHNAGLIPQI